MDRPITHIIDPDGEVIIILHNANAPFARFYDDRDATAEMPAQEAAAEENNHVPPVVETADNVVEQSQPEYIDLSLGTSRRKKGKKKLKKQKRVEEPAAEPVEELAPEPFEELVEEPIEEPPAEYEEPFEKPVEEFAGESVDESVQKSDQCQSEKDIYIQVSAKHLILASPVFKSMLTGRWKESVSFFEVQKCSIEITTESWDDKPLLILLRIIHCQFNQILDELDLEMLAKVAVIADYYRCRDVVQVFADLWIEKFKGEYPKGYTRDLILWLWIAWFFQLSDQFRTMTSIAMSHRSGHISNLGLPIPDRVIDNMNTRREEAMENIVAQLHDLRQAFLTGSRGCGFECSSIMYGALSKNMRSAELLHPGPTKAFLSKSYKQFVQEVRNFQSPVWYNPADTYHSRHSRHPCAYSRISNLFVDWKDTIDGLDLRAWIS